MIEEVETSGSETGQRTVSRAVLATPPTFMSVTSGTSRPRCEVGPLKRAARPQRRPVVDGRSWSSYVLRLASPRVAALGPGVGLPDQLALRAVALAAGASPRKSSPNSRAWTT